MAKTGFVDRLREILGSRRFLWIVTISFGILVVLYFLFATFLFNPLEDDLGDLAAVVPREADYFLRWKQAGARFDDFPAPRVWSAVESTDAFRELDGAGTIDDWGRDLGLEESLQRLEELSQALPIGLSLENDLMRELALVGRGQPKLDSNFDGALMLRVSFKVKAGVSLLGFDFVRNKLPESVGIESMGDGRYRLPEFPPFGFQDAFLMRIRDVVLLASRETWLDKMIELENLSGQGSLGQASIFLDNVETHPVRGQKTLEVFLRWPNLSSNFGSWPNPEKGQLQKILHRFFSTDMLRFISGYWYPDEQFVGNFGGDINLQDASPFQTGWYEGRPLQNKQVLKYAGFAPATSFLFAAMAGNPGRVLMELESTLEDDLRRLLEDFVVRSGDKNFRSVADLLRGVGDAMAPGMYLVLHPDDPDLRGYGPDADRDVPHDGSAVPLFAVMGDVREPRGRVAFDEVVDFFVNNVDRMGDGNSRPIAQSVTVAGHNKAFSFVSEAIPGTGEIVILMIPEPENAIVVSNSYKLAEDLLKTAFTEDDERGAKQRKLSLQENFQASMEGLRHGANLMFYLDPDAGKHWFSEAADEGAEFKLGEETRAAFDRERPAVERRLRQELFGASSGLTEAEQEQLETAVDLEMEEVAARLRRERLADLQDQLQRGVLPLYWLDWFGGSLRVNRRSANVEISGRLGLDS